MLKNKRGDVSNYITFLVVIFFLAVSFLVVNFSNDKISTIIKTTQLNSTNVSTAAAEQIDKMTSTTVQGGFVAIFGFLIIGMMISSFMIRIHPIFLFMYIIILAITLFVAVPVANAYQVLIGASAIASVASQQTMTNWIMQHIVKILIGVGALSMIITFAKMFGGSGANYSGGDPI